jgi:hypothetical protein
LKELQTLIPEILDALSKLVAGALVRVGGYSDFGLYVARTLQRSRTMAPRGLKPSRYTESENAVNAAM